MGRRIKTLAWMLAGLVVIASPLASTQLVSAQCALPTQQWLSNAVNSMEGEQLTEFVFPGWSSLGTITIPFVIEANALKAVPATTDADPNDDTVGINNFWKFEALYGAMSNGFGLYGNGDGVLVNRNFYPAQTRAYLSLDFVHGNGYIIANKSVTRFIYPVRDPLGVTHAVTQTNNWSAHTLNNLWPTDNNNQPASWFKVGWSSGDTFTVRVHLTEAVKGSGFAGAPSIDQLIKINKDTRAVSVTGDRFPSMGVYQSADQCRVLAERHEVDPNYLWDYQSISSLGAQPTWTQPTTASVPAPAPTNQAPKALFTYSRQRGPNNLVSFNGTTSYDPDGKVVKWEWLSGSTVIGGGPTTTIALGSGTSKSVALRVTDNRGATNTYTQTISLPNRTPVIDYVSPENGGTVGSNTPEISAVAHDDDADALQYGFHITGPSVDISSGFSSNASWTVPAHKLDPATTYTLGTTVRDAKGAQRYMQTNFTIAALPTAQDVVSTPSGYGYWQVATDGGVFAYGDAQFYGSLPGLGISVTNILGMSRTPDGGGYWLVGTDGGVFSFGNAQFHGSLPGLNIHVNNIVGMVPTKDGGGYWLVGSDGGVFAFGNAQFYGSMGGRPLNAPVIGIAATPDSGGYWLGAGDGGVFAFGNAPFYGSMGGQALNAPVTDIANTPNGKGYWLTAEDGGVFAFGNANFFGSMAGKPLNGHITGMSATPDGYGYWLTGCDGGIFAFGNAPFTGSQPRYGCRGF